jgi:hypothetical protein
MGQTITSNAEIKKDFLSLETYNIINIGLFFVLLGK